MEHTLGSECGASFVVSETAAGTRLACPCGRTLEIPSLRQLRRQSGLLQPELEPEFIIATLLLAGKLPEEKDCVLCAAPTKHVVRFKTECERARVKTGGPSTWALIPLIMLTGLFGVIAAALTGRKTEREWGKDVILDLPLRVCQTCAEELATTKTVKKAMNEVALYRRLLLKYPKALISLPVRAANT